METSIEPAIQATYKIINDLDRAGRKDLTIPLRMIVDRMWGDSPLMPNPFVFRKLEKETLEAWSQHLVDRETRANSSPSDYREQFVLEARVSAGGRMSFYGQHNFVVHRESELTFLIRHTFRGNLVDFDLMRSALSIETGPDMLRDEREIVALRKAEELGILTRGYIGTALGIPCEMKRTFFFHNAVDVETAFWLPKASDAEVFVARLRAISEPAFDPEEAERLARIVMLRGPKAALESAGLNADPDCEEAKRLRTELGVKRSALIDATRSVRDRMAERCHETGMTLPRLRLEVSGFWSEVERELAPTR